MFAELGAMYAWATPEYLLDYLSIDEVFFYYDKGLLFEQFKSRLLVNEISEALQDPKDKKPPRNKSDKPDKKAFYKKYPVERPGD